MTWTAIDLITSLENAKKIFKINAFRSYQEEVIHLLLGGNHCFVIMPTGMGKSLCYQIPGYISSGLTIVISPLIALMFDQVKGLKERGVSSALINSSLSKSERLSRYENIRKGQYKIIFVAPERFRSEEFISAVQSREISLLAIDEAHCVSQWGHDFRPDYSRIAEIRKILGNPTIIALTATATNQVQTDVIRELGFNENEIKLFHAGISRPNLYLKVESFIDEPDKWDQILSLLSDNESGAKIIYFNLIEKLEKFSDFLIANKIKHSVYHGKLHSKDKSRIQTQFIKDNCDILLATNSFGMGVDKSDIRMIIHAELPLSVEAYYQEIGRAGRDGFDAHCQLFYEESDLAVLMDFIDWQNPDSHFIKKVYETLRFAGEALRSMEYRDLQAKVVHKNRGDHRLQTVLNLFDRYGVTSGELERNSLTLQNALPQELTSPAILKEKKQNSLKRLYQMLLYIKLEGCRRDFLNLYFGENVEPCGHCDNCAKMKLIC